MHKGTHPILSVVLKMAWLLFGIKKQHFQELLMQKISALSHQRGVL